jgi:outer membrane scaffolding protein for murein synthesis (MipA/OmpV family)
MAGGLVLATAGLGAGAQAPAPPSDAPAAPATKLVPRPLWELGAGIGVVSLPDYVGSNQSRTYVLPVPYVEYRGEWLKADRDGARAFLIRDERVNVQLSAAAAVPANSRDNEARRGMPDLPPTVELGPNVEIHLARRAGAHDPRIDLRLPLRAAFTVEHQPRSVGFTFSPHVNLDLRELAGGWNLGLLTGPMFASERYHQLYYGVDPVFATPQRPAYQARAGYAGWRALAATSRRFGRTWVGAFARVDDVHGAVFESSPLVRRRNNFSAGIAVAWVFAASATLVPSED